MKSFIVKTEKSSSLKLSSLVIRIEVPVANHTSTRFAVSQLNDSVNISVRANIMTKKRAKIKSQI